VLSDNLTPKIDIPSLAFLRLGVIPLAFIVYVLSENILPSVSYII